MHNVSRKILIRSSSCRIILPTSAAFQSYNTTIQNQFSTSTSKKPSVTSLVKELRLQTGAPMIECKKALESSEHNITKATEWLRSNSLSKVSSKLENRIADDGLVGLAMSTCSSDNNAVLVKVSSETDFASRSDIFTKLVYDVANTALNLNPANTNDENGTSSLSLSDMVLSMNVNAQNNQTVQSYIEEATLSIREKLQLKEVEVVRTNNTVIMGYVHGKVPNYNNVGTSAALVELMPLTNDAGSSNSTTLDDMKDIGKKLAMHVVAAKPKYLNPESVPKEVLEKEKEILEVQISKLPGSQKKSPQILQRIINGKLEKYYQDVCLTKQGHMLEEKNPTIEKYLKSFDLKIVSYKHICI